jgi:hypothetical protein
VRLVMSRDEVFRATGPTSSTSMWVRPASPRTAGSPPAKQC